MNRLLVGATKLQSLRRRDNAPRPPLLQSNLSESKHDSPPLSPSSVVRLCIRADSSAENIRSGALATCDGPAANSRLRESGCARRIKLVEKISWTDCQNCLGNGNRFGNTHHGRRDTMRTRTFVHGLVVGAGWLYVQSWHDRAVCAAESPPAPSATIAEAAPGTTLEELVALAEASSPVLRQAAAEVESMRGKAYQAGLYPNPVASSGATQLAGRESQYFAGLSQEIVTKQKLKLDQAAVCREVVQAEFRFVRTRFELLTAVRQGYFLTLAAQRRMEVLTRLVEISSKSRQAAARLQEAGEGTRSDTLLFEIEVEKAEVALENAEAKWHAAQRQLVAILGLRDLHLERIHGNLTESLDGVATQVLLDGFVPYNADVQSAEQEVERNRFLLQRAIVQPFPNVTIYGGYQYQVQPLHNMALLQASVPLPLMMPT